MFVFSDTKFFRISLQRLFLVMEVKEYKEEDYRTVFGVTKITFEEMVIEVEKEYNNIHKKGAEKMVLLLKKESKLR